MTMTLISTQTVTTPVSSLAFTNIPQDGTDLVVLTSLRSTIAESLTNCVLNINLNFSSIYSRRLLYGNGTSTGSSSGTTTAVGFDINGTTTTANAFSNGMLYFPNYSGSINKSFFIDNVVENNSTSASEVINAVLFDSTSAITRLDFQATNLATGSTISLYKITKGSGGATVA
jgi:hypothetical protein